jgi:methionyl-tRNA formyltransferase
MRVIFMGTPHFAVPALEALAASAPPGKVWASGLDIVGIFTRPDKPAGRGRALAVSPVKEYALSCGMPVYQPGPLRAPEALALLHRLAPDLIVVAAFGQILPPAVLNLPRHSCVNLHASLLPRHRGAAPIAAAILADDAETGITLMEMEEGLDTGPIIAARALPIRADETAGELTERLAQLGAKLLVDTLPQWLAGSIAPTPQDAAHVTTTRLLRKADARVNWSRPAAEVARLVRAYTPAPGAFTTWQGRQLKLLRVREMGAGRPPDAPTDPGTVFLAPAATPGAPVLTCACGQGAVALEVIQLEGKRALPAAEFLRGHGAIVGARLGELPSE